MKKIFISIFILIIIIGGIIYYLNSGSVMILGEKSVVHLPTPLPTEEVGKVFYSTEPTILIPFKKSSSIGNRINSLDIKWDSSLFTDKALVIYLLKNGVFAEKITESAKNNGLYSWVVDKFLSDGDYEIEIMSPSSLLN